MYSNNYLENQVATASKEQLLIMFYDGAIRFARQAQQAIADGNIEQRNYGIQKSTAIIAELSATLDHEIGGEIALNLASLYDYMMREMQQANLKNDAKPLEIVIDLLSDLRETWIQAIEIDKAAKHGVAANADSGHKRITVSM
jgi:flagellar protein FliS